jgi:hypothetical protein
VSIFDQALQLLDDNPFEEEPVDLKEFVYSEDFLNLQKLSDIQELLVDLMSQVYRKQDLIKLYGEERGIEAWNHTKREIIMELGKGAGKDFTSTVGVAYLVYKLLCLKDPARYFNKPSGDAIDIINIAINAQQANNVFFKNFVTRIETCKWFDGKYQKKSGQIAFNKNITVHSGHSEREAWEGYNVIAVILDEIAGFAMDNNSGSESAKTADAIYDMYHASVLSRFPDIGKLILLSFPRFKGDFITKRYDEVIYEKEVVIKKHVFKINPDLPDDLPENNFEIEWEEDHIQTYKEPNVFALRRPSWDVNPFRHIDEYMPAFLRDPVDALGRFACMPPEAIDAFFKSRERVESSFSGMDLALDDDGRVRFDFKPEPGTKYFIHVDLAQKHDNCAVAMAHIDGWGTVGNSKKVEPRIVVDLVKYWKPKSDQPLNFEEVVNFILDVWRQGFDLRLVTFDRWNSVQTIEDLRAYGLRAEVLSVGLPHYTDFSIALNEGRVSGPKIDLLIDEMLALRIMKNRKVDHPRKLSKDLSDAVCGAIYNAVAHTVRSGGEEVEIFNRVKSSYDREEKDQLPQNVIIPPKQMPNELSDYLKSIRLL